MENGKKYEKKPISFSDIALALANDYENIYVIDADDDSYVEYLVEGDNKELVVRSSGVNFYADVVPNCREQVYPEDQEFFLASFKKESVTEILKNGKAFSLNYRLVINGEPVHYFLKTIKACDRRVIIGVRNVDEQRKRELKAEEEIQTYRHIAGALASRYEVIYYINIETNEYTQYSSSDEYAKLGTTKYGKDFFVDAEDDIKKYIHKDDMDRVLKEVDKETLIRNIDECGSVTDTYRQQLGDRTKYVTMTVVRPENDINHLIMGVMNIDERMRREQQLIDENRTFNELALALAKRYEVIYHVNINTDEYLEYSASDKYTRLEVGSKGRNFFAETQENMKRDIYPEDLPMMSAAMEKKNLLVSLAETGKTLLNYRLMLDGRPQYVNLVIIRPQEDSDQIIVAVENIDETKRRELELEKAVGSATDMANKDALTGVKNKRAYVQAEMQLDELLGKGEESEFAIAICDINGLKQVNDSQGHNAGDEFIKSACTIICNTFKHSPVFRIGGDEFVVILRGSDYQNRAELISDFGAEQIKNKENGLVTLAYGISVFNPAKDIRVQDVFERADNLMYENKKRFKGELPQVNNFNEEDPALRFYLLYEQLVSAMTDIVKIDVPRIESLLIEISKLFRLSKGVTRVYKNPREEASGGGETLCCFDTGKEGEEIISLRVVTSVMSSATLTVYMSPDEIPLTDEERWKVELVMRTTLSFVSRNRLKTIVEELAYYDDQHYPNFRSMTNYIMNMAGTGKYRGKAAVRYNLRHFSLINQEFGREAGDQIMRNHFETLKEMIGKEGFLSRLGGDNFVGICTADKLEKIVPFLSEAQIGFGDGDTVSVMTSAGIFVIPDDHLISGPGDVMKQIINAYRVAQGGGKDHIVYFDDTLFEKKERSMRVQQLFPEALKTKEFRPFYQPKVNTVTGKLEGAEALCRWFHGGKMIPPNDFIPMLEETSDICKLDIYMLENVCRDMRRWMDDGRNIVRVSVNFSRKNIMNGRLSDIIAEIIDRYGIPHEYIEIELTETTTDVEFSDLKRIANGLHLNGIYTSVDDFGVGFSSLNLIRDIPWDVVKIDRSFLPVEEDGEDSIRTVMFRHVVAMTRKLGLECIAEGVETKQQLEILKENYCELAQGYYFDRPLPVEEFENRLERGCYEVN